MSVQVTIDDGAIASWLQPGGMIDANMELRADRSLAEALQRVPYVTGALHDSGTTRRSDSVPGGWEVVFAIFYAAWVDQGTTFFRGRFYLRDSISAAIR
jgi:hypothetical protein